MGGNHSLSRTMIRCPLWTAKYYPKCLHLDNETSWCHRREGICDNARKYNSSEDTKIDTQFTCECGAKWNLISPLSDTDTCPDCGILVVSKR